MSESEYTVRGKKWVLLKNRKKQEKLAFASTLKVHLLFSTWSTVSLCIHFTLSNPFMDPSLYIKEHIIKMRFKTIEPDFTV